MTEDVKNHESNPIEYTQIEYCWAKPKPIIFITHWGESGDTLWVLPTYNSGSLEKTRGKFGLTKNNAKNTSNWMERTNFKTYTEGIYAVTNDIGMQKINSVDSEVEKLEKALSVLHVKLQQAKQRRIHTYRFVSQEFSIPITGRDLMSMRDQAHESGEKTIACFKVDRLPV